MAVNRMGGAGFAGVGGVGFTGGVGIGGTPTTFGTGIGGLGGVRTGIGITGGFGGLTGGTALGGGFTGARGGLGFTGTGFAGNTMIGGRGGLGFTSGFGGGLIGNRMGGNLLGQGLMNRGGLLTGVGASPVPVFRYQLDSSFPPAAPSVRTEVPARLTQVISSARSLPSRDNIRLEIVDGALVLTGEVATEYERTLAEALLRLEPGVYDLKNNLQVSGSQDANRANGASPPAGSGSPNGTPPPSSPPSGAERKD